MRRAVAAIALVLGASLVLPAAGRATEAPELAGSTVLRGAAIGRLDVYLPEAVTISTEPFRNDFAKISTQGTIAGFVLKRVGGSREIEVMGFSVSACASTECDARPLVFTQVYDPKHFFKRKATLEPGLYNLFLVADGPTEVELSFPGLAGSTTFDAFGPAESMLEEPKNDVFVALPGGNFFSASADGEMSSIGLSLMALTVETDAELLGNVSMCVQRKRSPISGTSHWIFCEGSGGSSTFIRNDLEAHRQVFVSLDTVGKGPKSLGMSYTLAGRVREAKALVMLLEYPGGKRSWGAGSMVWMDD